MFKCSKLSKNLEKNHYLMVKTAKNYFLQFSYSKCVCVTVLKRFLKSLMSYGMYIKFSSGYQLIIINVRIPNPLHINFLNFDLQRLPLMFSPSPLGMGEGLDLFFSIEAILNIQIIRIKGIWVIKY